MVFISLTFCYHFNYYTKELILYFNNWQKNLSLIILGKDVKCRNLKISFSYVCVLLYFAHIPLCYLCCLPPLGLLSKESRLIYVYVYMCTYMHAYICVFNMCHLLTHSPLFLTPPILLNLSSTQEKKHAIFIFLSLAYFA